MNRGGVLYIEGQYNPDFDRFSSSATFINCTMVGNSAAGSGGAIYNKSSRVTLQNCIVWDNGAAPLMQTPATLFDRAETNVLYSIVEGGFEGEGNLDTNPLFVNETIGDHRLTAESPAIDTGTAEPTPGTNSGPAVEVPEDDLEGTTRPQGAGIDMGAYEYVDGQPVRYLLEVATDGMGEVATDPTPGLLDAGTEITVTATPAEGYAFARWEGDVPDGASATANPLTFSIMENTTLTAVFESLLAQVTLTIAAEGMGTVEPPVGDHTYDEGTEVTLTATPADGYAFAGWDGAVMTDTNPLTYTLNADATLTALFLEEFALTLQTDGNGTVTPFEGTQTYLDGATLTLEATGNDGFLFDQWTGDLPTPEAAMDNPLTLTIEADTTLTATFTPAPKGCHMSTRGKGATNSPASDATPLLFAVLAVLVGSTRRTTH